MHDAPPIILRTRLLLSPSARRSRADRDALPRRDARSRSRLRCPGAQAESQARSERISRANPFSKVTDRFFRLPLSALFVIGQRLLASKTCCGRSVRTRRRFNCTYLNFHRTPRRHGRRFSAAHRSTHSAVDVLLATLPRKESSFRAPQLSSPGVFASPPGPGTREVQKGKSPCRDSVIDIRFPYGRPVTRARSSSRACCHPQARLHHDRSTFACDPSPFWPSRVSLEYLLLPPRSAPPTARAELAPRHSTRSAPTYSGGRASHVLCLVSSCTRSAEHEPKLQCHPFSGPIDSAGESLYVP